MMHNRNSTTVRTFRMLGTPKYCRIVSNFDSHISCVDILLRFGIIAGQQSICFYRRGAASGKVPLRAKDILPAKRWNISNFILYEERSNCKI